MKNFNIKETLKPMFKIDSRVSVDVLDRNVKSGIISTDDVFTIKEVISRNDDIFYRLKDEENGEYHVIHQDNIMI